MEKRKGKILILWLATAILVPLYSGVTFSAYAQQDGPPELETEPSAIDLHEELEKTLTKVKTHYERVQDSLEKSGVERDATLEAGIKELEKDQDSMIERLEGLAKVLLKSEDGEERETEDPPDVDYAKVEEEFVKVLDDMQAYIDAREQHWEDVDIDSEQKLKEELTNLVEEQEVLKDMVDDLADEIEEVWEEVKSGWSDKLQEWQDLISDLFSDDD
jgi:uncharacterized protein YlxW (UPF0749 family)